MKLEKDGKLLLKTKNIHLKKKKGKNKSPNQAGKKRMEEENSSSCIGEEQTAVNSWTMIWIHVAQNFGATSNGFSWSKKIGHKHCGFGGFIPNIEDQFLLKFGANKSAKSRWHFCWHLTSLCVDLSWALLFITHLPYLQSDNRHTFTGAKQLQDA